MRAARNGHPSVMKILLEHGADPSERDNVSIVMRTCVQ
jgi:ankyrin repeat protein